MKKNYVLAAIVGVVGLVCSVAVCAQDRKAAAAAGDFYVISAKAGGVNFVEGGVSVKRANGTAGMLLKGDQLEIGDRVTTDASGKAELLLNPGSYLRVGGGTSFEFASTSLDDLKIKLYSGSAVLEVITADDFLVSLEMPHSSINLKQSGVFRVDVLPDGTSRLSVTKGKARFGPDQKAELKSGRSVIVGSPEAVVTKLDSDAKDQFDVWSKDRAKELVKLNAKLQDRNLRNTLMNSFNQSRWNMYNSFGLWVYDPSRTFWCFLPFGSGWGSPYGWFYSWDIWNVGMPNWVFRDPRIYGPGYGRMNNGAGTAVVTGNGNPTNATSTGGRMGRPPFQRIQGGGVTQNDVVVPGGRSNVGRDSGPVFSPATQTVRPSPAAADAPAPNRVPVGPRKGERDN